MIDQSQSTQNNEQWQDANLYGNHHTNHKIAGQQSPALKPIAGNAIGRHGGNQNASRCAADGQNQAVEEIPGKIALQKHFCVICKRNHRRQAHKIGDEIALGFQ